MYNMNGRFFFERFKFLIFIIVYIVRPLPRCVKVFLYELFSIMPTNLGVLLRYIVLKSQAEFIGNNVYIARNVIIKNIHRLKIGNNVSIHEFCYIDAIGGISINDDVSIAHSSSLISFEHSWGNRDLAIKYNDLKLEPIYIDSNIWVGCGVRILAGSKLSTKTVVGAGAIINKKYPPNVVIVGAPGKIIKEI